MDMMDMSYVIDFSRLYDAAVWRFAELEIVAL